MPMHLFFWVLLLLFVLVAIGEIVVGRYVHRVVERVLLILLLACLGYEVFGPMLRG